MSTEMENLEQTPLAQKQIEDEIKKVNELYKASQKVENQTGNVVPELAPPAEAEHIERAHFTPW